MRSLSIILALFISFTALGQSDPIVQVRGSILDAESQQPVEADLFYELLPYGDEVGSLKIANDSSIFDIYLKQDQEYRVKVESEGYFPYVETYTVPGGQSLITKNILLQPGGVGYVEKLENLVFAQGKSDIDEKSHQELDELAEVLLSTPTMIIQLEGHTDPAGSASGNMRLSQQRVDAVRNYLISKGVKGEQVQTKAFGGTQPLTRETTPEARATNRRVEVRVLAI